MPYAEDPAKRTRYRSFLEQRAGLRGEGTLPERADGMSTDDWVKEMKEFSHAAQVFKPMTGIMASRFTSSSSSSATAPGSERLSNDNQSLLSRPVEKVEDPAEQAAKVGMYGPLTRSTSQFFPTRLLCKRFNVKPPAHVQMDPGKAPEDIGREAVGTSQSGGVQTPTHSEALPGRRLELVGKRDMDDLIRERGGGRGIMLEGGTDVKAEPPMHVIVDPERNEALEQEKPGEAVFKAIFGSDSEDD